MKLATPVRSDVSATTPTTLDAVFRREFARLARSLAVVDGHEAAADAVQEAFVSAASRWSRVGRLEDPGGWIRRAALNRLLNHRRDRTRRLEILRAIHPVSEVDLDPLDLDLLRAIRALPRRQSLAISLHHLGGYPVNEVAAAMDISPGTVKSHLHDARRALRTTLEETHDER